MTREADSTFSCFGSTCSVRVSGRDAPVAVAAARRRLLGWHERFTRFSRTSELSRLNADSRGEVPASPIMRRFAAAVLDAASLTRGLVDATLLAELELAGYDRDPGPALPLPYALALAPPRRPARPRPGSRWRALSVGTDSIRRPPGLLLDSGGLAKGMFADVLAEQLASRTSFAVECAGDLRVGGAARPVTVTSPFDGQPIYTFELADVGVATSGIGKRSWLDRDARPAHHLLDPASGRPAFTGVVQATAIAPTALEAEARAKAAVLAGPEQAWDWLPRGGVVVLEDGRIEAAEPAPRPALAEPADIPAGRLHIPVCAARLGVG